MSIRKLTNVDNVAKEMTDRYLDTFPTEVPEQVEKVVLPRLEYIKLVQLAKAKNMAPDIEAKKEIDHLTQWLNSAEHALVEKDTENEALKAEIKVMQERAAKRETTLGAKDRETYRQVEHMRAMNAAYEALRRQLTTLTAEYNKLLMKKCPEASHIRTQTAGVIELSAAGVEQLDRTAVSQANALKAHIKSLEDLVKKNQDTREKEMRDVMARLEDLLNDYA